MTGPDTTQPDLAALREKALAVIDAKARFEANGYDPSFLPACLKADYAFGRVNRPRDILAVLALVDEQKARIRTLEKALRIVVNETNERTDAHSVAVAALSGSPVVSAPEKDTP